MIGWEGFVHYAGFSVSPVRNEFKAERPSYAEADETCFVGCAEHEAEAWAIYGRTVDGIADHIDDYPTPRAAFRDLLRILGPYRRADRILDYRTDSFEAAQLNAAEIGALLATAETQP